MTLRQTLEAFVGLDSAHASGQRVADLLAPYSGAKVSVEELAGEHGKTDFVKIMLPGSSGKSTGGTSPTLVPYDRSVCMM
jgi:hypothetical protein